MKLSENMKLVTLVVSVYGVEEYLPAFLRSIQEQSSGLARTDLVFVIDGSPDKSADVIREWASVHAQTAIIVEQANGGASAARNTGLAHVKTEWVSFPDPDDVLDNSYLATVFSFMNTKAGQSADLLATNLLTLNDETGEVTNGHPLRVKFAKTAQVVDLNRHPNYIQLSAATGFYRMKTIAENSLKFDVRVKPNFEDAHFTAHYLFSSTNTRIGLLKDAKYLYRKRENGSSLVQTSWQKPEKYTDLLVHGYLEILETASKRFGYVPEWTQNLVLYDIFWFLREDDRMHSATANLDPDLATKFHESLHLIMEHIQEHVIADFRVIKTNWYHRQELIHKFKPKPVRYTDVSVNALDVDKQIVRLRYYFSGDLPVETFRARGFAIEPIHATVQDYQLFGVRMMSERIAWMPATGTLSMELDGNRVQLKPGGFPDSPYLLAPSTLWKSLAGTSVPQIGKSQSASTTKKSPRTAQTQIAEKLRATNGLIQTQLLKKSERSADLLVKRLERGFVKSLVANSCRTVDLRCTDDKKIVSYLDALPDDYDNFSAKDVEIVKKVAKSRGVKKAFENAWVLMDRDTEAHDNGEHLYRYLAKERSDVNAWFVLSKGSNDWDRLEQEGFRLIEHGSYEHLVLLLHCEHLVSSQVDHYVVHPYSPRKFGRFPWKFTFLQHGVSKDDVSRWLNRKPIDLLVTASQLEYDEFVRCGGPYRFSSKDTVLSGMPRFDRLFTESRKIGRRGKTLLLMPTWRRWLLGDAIDGGNLREVRDDFWDSTYARAWVGLLESEELRLFAQKHGLNVAFMPHPNMRPYLTNFPCPEHVAIYSYEDTDVQELLVHGAALVTDYSSIAFDGAYIDVPVLYFQFDRQEFFSGNHVFRAGSWSYDDNGLGPVAESTDELMGYLREIAESGFVASEVFTQRVCETFPVRDEFSSQRVVEAIEEIKRPLAYEEAYRRVSEIEGVASEQHRNGS